MAGAGNFYTILSLLLLANALALVPLVIFRLLAVLPSKTRRVRRRRPGTPTRLLVVLGSGGHTAEMLEMLHALETPKYTRRTYLVSSGDDFSAARARDFEQSLAEAAGMDDVDYGTFDIRVVPRARRIHQPAWTAPVSCVQCLLGCWAVLRDGGAPDVIVLNGPATAVIVVLAALLLKFVGLEHNDKMRTVYVESWARVKRLSLSGRILHRLVDRFLVQWEALKDVAGPPAEYRGVLL